jgi:nucleoside diphosphate kinase
VHATPSHLEQRKFVFVPLVIILTQYTHADYADLQGKPFFPGLIKYMASGPVVAMVWQGLDAVKTGRAMLGATNPLASPIGKCIVEIVCHLTDLHCRNNSGGLCSHHGA